MKKIIVLTSISFLILNVLFGQIHEDFICATAEEDMGFKSASLANIIDIDAEPIKYIRINLVFLRNDLGFGGFEEGNPDHQQYISDMIATLNNTFANVQLTYDSACYGGEYGTFYDSKVRFSVENTMYINNTYYWNNENSTTYYGCPESSSNYHLSNLVNTLEQSSLYPILNHCCPVNRNIYNFLFLTLS